MTVTFKPNKVQRDYAQNRSSRDLVLKARQVGITTYALLDNVESILLRDNLRCMVIADKEDTAKSVLERVRFTYENLPEYIRIARPTVVDSKTELKLNNGSSIKVAVDGRGGTFQRIHVTEFSSMRKDRQDTLLNGALPTLNNKGYALIESTPRGRGEFYQLWNNAPLPPHTICAIGP